jgi:uncharacterized LabA/DUF88 family protein
MHDGSVFDRLVQELSQEERQKMLSGLAAMFEQENDPVHPVEEDPEPVNLESEYALFPFFKKLIVLLRTFFTPLTRMEIIEDAVMRRIASHLENSYPGLYDYQTGMVSPLFLKEMKRLHKGIQVFTVPISRLTSRRKEELFALLINQDMPHIENRINETCRPSNFSSDTGEESEKELHRQVYNQFEDILEELTPEERGKLNQDARSLQLLTEFVFFSYEKITARFSAAGKGAGCSGADLKDSLNYLTRIFHSMNVNPSFGLLEALFMVTRLEQEDLDPGEFFESLGADMKKARDTLVLLRQFYRQIPLYDLLRLVSGKATVFLKPLAGGEEWLSLLRSFYKNKLRRDVRRYLIRKEYDQCIREALELLEMKELETLPHYNENACDGELTLKHVQSLAFLKTYIQRLFSLKLNPPLKQVLIDGEFYKEQNSEEYSEAYNGLHLLLDSVEQAADFLSPGGEGGRKLHSIFSDGLPAVLRDRKTAAIAADADKLAGRTIYRGDELLTLLSSVIYGILFGEKGGRFDTLSNLGYIGGRSNESFRKNLEACYHSIDTARRILSAMVRLEEGYAESA